MLSQTWGSTHPNSAMKSSVLYELWEVLLFLILGHYGNYTNTHTRVYTNTCIHAHTHRGAYVYTDIFKHPYLCMSEARS